VSDDLEVAQRLTRRRPVPLSKRDVPAGLPIGDRTLLSLRASERSNRSTPTAAP
jgi:hypothetical protein